LFEKGGSERCIGCQGRIRVEEVGRSARGEYCGYWECQASGTVKKSVPGIEIRRYGMFIFSLSKREYPEYPLALPHVIL
jgi:hypothetical protein